MKPTLTAIDLFSGAGGFHMGFERAGFDIKFCIDNNNLVDEHTNETSCIPIINKMLETSIQRFSKSIGRCQP